MSTHGGADLIGDCYATGNWLQEVPWIQEIFQLSKDQCIAGAEIFDFITSKTPLAPNNPYYNRKSSQKSIPPYNFVDLDVCDGLGAPDTSTNVSLLTAFMATHLVSSTGITTVGPLPSVGSDRAMIGFQAKLAVTSYNACWTQSVWDYLGQGHTLDTAVKMSIAQIGYPEGYWSGIALGYLPGIVPIIKGDPAMTLHSVHGQTDEIGRDFEPLQFRFDYYFDDNVFDWFKPL